MIEKESAKCRSAVRTMAEQSGKERVLVATGTKQEMACGAGRGQDTPFARGSCAAYCRKKIEAKPPHRTDGRRPLSPSFAGPVHS